MRVLLLHNPGSPDLPSGESVVFETEAAALRASGIDVRTFTYTRPLGKLASLKRANVLFSRRAYREVQSRIDEFQPDVVHAHAVLPDLTASVFAACHAARIPVVQTLHNYRWLCVEGGLFYQRQHCEACVGNQGLAGVRRRCSRNSFAASAALTVNNVVNVRPNRLFRWVDRFIAVSDFVKKAHIRGGFPPHKLIVKYNPVSNSPSQRGEPYVAFVGRLDIAKGTPILADLPALLPDVHFKIAGNGPDLANLQAAMGGLPNVRILGRIDLPAAHALIAQAACTVVPSLVPESFGLAAAESLAAGVPVVASRRGALTELLEQSGGGVAIDPQQGPRAFARAIREILTDGRTAERLGRCGLAFAEQHLRSDATTARLVEIYSGLIHKKQDYAQVGEFA